MGITATQSTTITVTHLFDVGDSEDWTGPGPYGGPVHTWRPVRLVITYKDDQLETWRLFAGRVKLDGSLADLKAQEFARWDSSFKGTPTCEAMALRAREYDPRSIGGSLRLANITK